MEKTIFMGLIIGAVAMAMISASVIPSTVNAQECNPQGRTTGDPHLKAKGDPHEDGEKGNPHKLCKMNLAEKIDVE